MIYVTPWREGLADYNRGCFSCVDLQWSHTALNRQTYDQYPAVHALCTGATLQLTPNGPLIFIIVDSPLLFHGQKCVDPPQDIQTQPRAPPDN